MGYTHYWEGAGESTPELLRQIHAVVQESGIPLAGGFGEGQPEIDDKHIWLNGVGPDDDYETFLVNFGNPEWTFCKTAHRPYDTVVVAILHLLDEAWDSFSWSSDGDDADHAAGRELAFTAMGHL